MYDTRQMLTRCSALLRSVTRAAPHVGLLSSSLPLHISALHSSSSISASNAPHIGLIGICEDSNSSYMRGPALAPPSLRAALTSDSANSFCEGGEDVAGAWVDYGDVVPLDTNEATHESIRARVREVLDAGLVPLTLGGDHSVSFPVISEVAKWYESKCKSRRRQSPTPSFTVLHLDAHTDLYDELDGNRLSHACPFARLMEENERREEEGAGKEGLGEEEGGGGPSSSPPPMFRVGLAQVGVRTITTHHREQFDRFDVQVVQARHTPTAPHELEELLENIFLAEEAVDGGGDGDGGTSVVQTPSGEDRPPHYVYLSLDLDVLDPAFAPGVSHHEPGGLTTRQVLDIIHALPVGSGEEGGGGEGGGGVRLVGADVVEYNPLRDVNSTTAMVGAKCMKELMGRMIRDRGTGDG